MHEKGTFAPKSHWSGEKGFLWLMDLHLFSSFALSLPLLVGTPSRHLRMVESGWLTLSTPKLARSPLIQSRFGSNKKKNKVEILFLHKRGDLYYRAAAGSRKPIISEPNQLSLHASGSAVNKRTKIELTSLERGTTKLYNDAWTFFVHGKMAAVAAVIRQSRQFFGYFSSF